MKITWFGHSCFRIDTGKTQHPDRSVPHRQPDLRGFRASPCTSVAKGVTHVALTHGHEDHTGDTVAICKETGAPLIAVL